MVSRALEPCSDVALRAFEKREGKYPQLAFGMPRTNFVKPVWRAFLGLIASLDTLAFGMPRT
jgi:hypothetical protein